MGIEEVENLLDTYDGVSPVHSHFYLLASDLHKIQGKHALFYRASLRYLGCTEVGSLAKEEQAGHAFHLALAALLGDRIFNFGDVAKFGALKPQWTKQTDLARNEAILFQKVCLLCLMEMTFRREATQRQILFTEIATATTLPVDQVEMLIMKALAQGLVKGKIDEVAGSVSLTWVQPRVLDATQLESMLQKIGGW